MYRPPDWKEVRHEAQAPRRRASAAGARHPVGGRLPPSSGAGGHRLFLPYPFSVQIHALPLLLGCAAAALAFLGLWSLPRRWWALPLALLAAAWVLAVRRLWQPLALGAEALRVDVVNTVSASLELGFTLEPALSLPEALWTNCATLLVLLALVPLGALLGLGVVRLRSFWLVFVSSFPFVLLPLCISVTPGWLPLMALVLGWVVPALTSLLARTSPLGAVRLNLAALPAAALLLAALSLAMPMDTYQRPAWADRALQHLTNQAVRLGDGLLEGSGPFGIGSGGSRRVTHSFQQTGCCGTSDTGYFQTRSGIQFYYNCFGGKIRKIMEERIS